MNSKAGAGKAQKLEKVFLIVGVGIAIVGIFLTAMAVFVFTTTTTVYDCEVVSVFNSTYHASYTLETGEIITTENNMSFVEFSSEPVGFSTIPNHNNLSEGDNFQITVVDERIGERMTYAWYGVFSMLFGWFLIVARRYRWSA